MLSKPDYGWSDIQIGNYYGDVSYLTDLPMDILNSAIQTLESNIPFYLYVNHEGSASYLTSYYDKTIIVWLRDEGEWQYMDINGKPCDPPPDHTDKKLYVFDIGYKDVIAEMVSDIEKDIDAWADWFMPDDRTLVEERKIFIKKKIEAVKKLLVQEK